MNTKLSSVYHRVFSAIMGFALIATISGAQAADSMKGAERLMHLNRITTQAEAEALKPGDTIAMACAKCKSAIVMQVTPEAKHLTKMVPGSRHLCPGCQSYIEVKGQGKGARQTIKHVCKACGSSSAYCCATKSGSAATEGMNH